MTQLQVRLRQPWAQGYIEAGALATVRLLADFGGRVTKEWWTQEKPVAVAGNDARFGEFTAFDLPSAGYYSVDITRPRGPDISREFLIKEGEVRTETITAEASPHEYLGWQQYAGVVGSEAASRAKFQVARHAEVPKVFAASLSASERAWAQVEEVARGKDRYWARAGGPLNWEPRSDPEFVVWFRPMPNPEEGIELIKRLRGTGSPGDSAVEKFPRWLSFETDGQIDLASVPWAWWGARREQDEEIRFLYNLTRPSSVAWDVPGHLTISVQDRRWLGLLEFLSSGRLNRVGDMFDKVLPREDPRDLYHPEIALYGKVKGPLVAVAGGIILVARSRSTEVQEWDNWLENLSKWFPGIPDGPILLGCRRLTQARSLDDITVAYRHLREGIERGIPFFSASIRMLSLALAQIGDDIPDSDKDRRYIASVATRVDPDQAFTVIRL